jgi:hypothetical protein
MTIIDYNYYFGGVDNGSGKNVSRTLTSTDKDNLLALFKDGGVINMDASITLLSLSFSAGDNIGAFGLSLNDVVSMKFTFPHDAVDFALNGIPKMHVFNFNDAAVKGWWLRNYSLTYARNLPEIPQTLFEKITVGFTLKYVQGFLYAGTDHVNSSISTQANNAIASSGDVLAYSAFSPDFNFSYSFDSTGKSGVSKNVNPFPKPAGTGMGFDFGISGKLDDIWSFGLSITDIGSIKWTKNVAKFEAHGGYLLTEIGDKEIDSLRDSFLGKGELYSEFTTSLPTVFRVGASFRLDKYLGGNFPGTMLIAADYNQGFNDQPGNSKNPRFSLGTEWKPSDWIPIRTGVSFGGDTKFNWAFGFGLDTGVLEFDFATPDFHYLFMANEAKRITLAMGALWKF